VKVSVAQRCVHHPAREAVACCPECGRFFCRECVSEHDDRVLCARCLARVIDAASGKRSRFAQLLRCFAALLSILIAWWFFDLIGRGLILLPADVHEGTIWKKITNE
jgi:uncharacterized paraquat-inducible protein A